MADPEAGVPLLQESTQPPDAELGQVPAGEPAEHWTRKTARNLYTFVSSLGTSVFFGILTAFGFKTIGQSVAIAIVLLFIGFQVLSYYGFINFNFAAVSGAVARRLDLNADGRLDLKDVGVCCHRTATWTLSWGLPSACGFVLGFWFGWRIL